MGTSAELFGTHDHRGLPITVGREKPVPDHAKQPRWQKAVSRTLWTLSTQKPKIGARPCENVGLGQNHPGSLAVEAQPGFDNRWNLDGRLTTRRWRMGDRERVDPRPPAVIGDREDDRAWPILPAFFLAGESFAAGGVRPRIVIVTISGRNE